LPRTTPPSSAPERHEEVVFYFEPAPPSESSEAGPAGQPPPDDEAVPDYPTRHGWRNLASGVVILAAAGGAAYFFTPLRSQVDRWLAPEAPAPVVVTPGTSVGSGQPLPEVTAPPPEPAPPIPATQGPRPETPLAADERKPNPVGPAAGVNKQRPDAAQAAHKPRTEPSDKQDVKTVTRQPIPATAEEQTDTAAAEEPGPPQHAATDDAVKGLVGRYVAAQDRGDIDGLVALYDDRVDFHEYKLAGPDYIRSYRREFFEKWPKVETVLVGPIEINWSDAVTADVVFTTSIHVREPPLDNPGKTRNKLTVRVTHGGGLKIVSEHQEVKESPS
jgi:hypothetical protein